MLAHPPPCHLPALVVHGVHTCSLRPLLQDCFDLDEARRSYFSQLFPLNPGAIVPSGPTAADLGLHLPPGRGSASFADAFHLVQCSAAAV